MEDNRFTMLLVLPPNNENQSYTHMSPPDLPPPPHPPQASHKAIEFGLPVLYGTYFH